MLFVTGTAWARMSESTSEPMVVASVCGGMERAKLSIKSQASYSMLANTHHEVDVDSLLYTASLSTFHHDRDLG